VGVRPRGRSRQNHHWAPHLGRDGPTAGSIDQEERHFRVNARHNFESFAVVTCYRGNGNNPPSSPSEKRQHVQKVPMPQCLREIDTFLIKKRIAKILVDR
jgi:hypothetical protein